MKACFVNTDLRYTAQESAHFEWIVISQECQLWRGDKVFLQCLIESDIDLSSVLVDCPSDSNISIVAHPATSTKAFIGHAGWYANNKNGVIPNGPRKMIDDILTNDNNFSLRAGVPKSIWLEISTSAKAKSGDYNYRIFFFSNELRTDLELRVDILPLSMPSPRDYSFNVEYWHHPYNVAEYYGVEPFSDHHMNILKSHQEFYRDLGGCGVVASIVDEAWGGQTFSNNRVKYPSMIEWHKGINGVMYYDYTVFDKWVQLNKDIGLGDKIICYSLLPWGSNISYIDDVTSKVVVHSYPPTFIYTYKKVWGHFLNSFIAHLDSKGWFDCIYLGFDERLNLAKVLKFIKTFHNREGRSFKTSASFNNFTADRKCFDQLNYASIGLDEARNNSSSFTAAAQSRRLLNQDTTIYTATEHFPNSFVLSLPCESYWTILYSYSLGATGFLRWAYDAWVSDPLKDTTHCSFPAGDCFLVYPSPKSTKNPTPQWSTRLVKLDEGVRAVNKMIIISQNSKYADRVKELLLSIKSNYSHDILKDLSWGVSVMNAKWSDKSTKHMMPIEMNNIKVALENLFRLVSSN